MDNIRDKNKESACRQRQEKSTILDLEDSFYQCLYHYSKINSTPTPILSAIKKNKEMIRFVSNIEDSSVLTHSNKVTG